MIGVKFKVTGVEQLNRYNRRKVNTSLSLCQKVNRKIGDRVHKFLLQNLPEWDGDLKASIQKTEVTFVKTARLWFRFPVRHLLWAEEGRPSAKARTIPGNPRHTMRYWTLPHRQGQIIFRKRVGPAPQQPNKVLHAHAIARSATWGNSIATGEARIVVKQWLKE